VHINYAYKANVASIYINTFYTFIPAVLGLLLYLYFSKKQASLFFIIAYEECFLGRYFLIVAFMKGSFIKSTFYIESTFYENC